MILFKCSIFFFFVFTQSLRRGTERNLAKWVVGVVGVVELIWYWAWGMESVVYFCFFFFSFHISTGMLNTMGRERGVGGDDRS